MGEIAHNLEPRGPRLEVVRQPPADVLEFRRRFVTRMGWFDDSHLDDRDIYDQDLGTRHLVSRAENGTVLSAMRLTNVSSLESSLSYAMLSPEMRESVDTASEPLAVAAQRGDLWDLTRLVNETDRRDPRFYDSLVSILELFGAGLAQTALSETDQPVWMFATTEGLKRHLDECGIEHTVLADGASSLFCYVEPATSMARLSQRPDKQGVYEVVKKGFDAAREGTEALR